MVSSIPLTNVTMFLILVAVKRLNIPSNYFFSTLWLKGKFWIALNHRMAGVERNLKDYLVPVFLPWEGNTFPNICTGIIGGRSSGLGD